MLQLLLFPFAATLEVKNATLAILQPGPGRRVRSNWCSGFAAAHAFPTLLLVHEPGEVARASSTSSGRCSRCEIPADFSRDLGAGQPATLLAVDRRAPLEQRADRARLRAEHRPGLRRRARGGRRRTAASRIVVRNWFNPNLEYRWFVLPVLVAIITTLGSLIVTALSVAREREQGTFDQLLVSPLTPGLIMVGKTVPALLIAVGAGDASSRSRRCSSTACRSRARCCCCTSACSVYALSLAGFGLLISSLCETQQQAFLGVFTFMVPAVMLSGFIAPVENMPLLFCGRQLDRSAAATSS